MFDRFIENRTLIYALAIILLSLMMMPVYWTVVTAFKPDVETYVFPPVYFPKNPTLVPLQLLFESYPFVDYLRNSIIVAGVTTVLVTFTGMLAAYGISQYPFRGGNVAIIALLVTRIIPPLSLLLPFYLMVSWLGLVDNLLSMIIANIYLTYPFAVLIMKSFFDAFPEGVDRLRHRGRMLPDRRLAENRPPRGGPRDCFRGHRHFSLDLE